MRTIMFMTAMLLASSLVASAQNASGGDGTSPQNPGSTEWTGAHPETGGATLDQNTDKPKQGKPTDATTGQGVTLHDESEAKDQPAVATGQDLKGPARQFPPSKNQNSQRFKPE
ncbi:MAG: hypothetical protein WA796_22630 [Pseudolabrys sp.]|jgi:hypothetical protein